MTNYNSYLTYEEISQHLHISVGTARNRLSQGEPMPPSIKIGRRRLFPAEELDLWLKTKLVSNDNGVEAFPSRSHNKETF